MSSIDLEELMTIEFDRWAAALGEGGFANENYGSACLLTYYYYHVDDKGDAAHIIAWLREIENAKSDEAVTAATKKHLLRDRSYAQLSEDVKKACAKKALISVSSPQERMGPPLPKSKPAGKVTGLSQCALWPNSHQLNKRT